MSLLLLLFCHRLTYLGSLEEWVLLHWQVRHSEDRLPDQQVPELCLLSLGCGGLVVCVDTCIQVSTALASMSLLLNTDTLSYISNMAVPGATPSSSTACPEQHDAETGVPHPDRSQHGWPC